MLAYREEGEEHGPLNQQQHEEDLQRQEERRTQEQREDLEDQEAREERLAERVEEQRRHVPPTQVPGQVTALRLRAPGNLRWNLRQRKRRPTLIFPIQKVALYPPDR